jgi:16S rRNA (adenine1518-N6/adenine1519-N6)-dimethyltransferase
VTSAVVHLDALPAPRFPADPRELSEVVALAFNQRRKMLRSSLRALGPGVEALLAAAGIPPTERAERVSLEAFCRLSRLVEAARARPGSREPGDRVP